MRQEFRQPKYLNESGSKKGQYFLNRLDYFEFHQYPNFKRDRILSFVGFFLALHLLSYASAFSHIFWCAYMLFCLYLAYISVTSFIILYRQVCPYRGYACYPKSWLAFFRSIKKEVDPHDFDSIATMNQDQ